MFREIDSTGNDVQKFLERQKVKSLLRFITCGSVDDGKSTLIGRLLYDFGLVPDDQLAGLKSETKHFGSPEDNAPNLALLLDGLAAEREQGITIDVAYRYFSTERRKFIVADAPGHEQYTRNMVTGASSSSAAVVLVDARKGILTQTRRHTYLLSLLGVNHVILAVNKMDLVLWDELAFRRIESEYLPFALQAGIKDVQCIPVCALSGDNVSRPSDRAPWYIGRSLIELLEAIDVRDSGAQTGFRMPVQWINRPHQDFRGVAGTVQGSAVCSSDPVQVLPSGVLSRVARIVTFDGDLHTAQPGQAVTIVLADDVDVSRGDVIASIDHTPEVTDHFSAHIVCLSDTGILPGRPYYLRIGSAIATAQIKELKFRLDINTGDKLAEKEINTNQIAFCNLSLDRVVVLDSYDLNQDLGGFILIDRITNATVGCGMVRFPLRRASNITWYPTKVDKVTRASAKAQTPCVLWFTGLSGSGKSTIADLMEQKLTALGKHTMLLDGDNVRHGLNRDLGFSAADRVENIRRAAEAAKLMVEAGLITLVSFISPFRNERAMARQLFAEGEFLEIYVDTPLSVCEARDPKGLYKKARAGNLPNFTGIDSPYEPPQSPELRVEGGERPPHELADHIIHMLEVKGLI